MRVTGWAPAEWSEMISDELETSGTIAPMMKTMSSIFMMGSPNVTETSRLTWPEFFYKLTYKPSFCNFSESRIKIKFNF